jgi:hypothetical protein
VLEEFGQTPDPDDPLVRRSRERWDAIRTSMWPFARRTPDQPLETWLPPPMPAEGWSPPAAPSKKSSKSKQKAKRKMAAASRKANKSKKKRK